MKKVLIFLSVAAIGVLLVARAAQPVAYNFINGSGVWVTNNTTHTFSDTNLFYTNSVGSFVQSTNVAAITDVQVPYASDGVVPVVRFLAKWTGTNVNSSNQLTFTLRAVCNGVDADTFVTNDVALSTIPLGTTSGTVTLPVAAALVNACKTIRLQSIGVSSVGSSGTIIVNKMQLVGFSP